MEVGLWRHGVVAYRLDEGQRRPSQALMRGRWGVKSGKPAAPSSDRLTRLAAVGIGAAVAAIIAGLVGCATPARHSGAPYRQLDKDTEYSVEDRPNGFRLSVTHSRHQFWPELSKVERACRTTVISVAHDIAVQRGRRIRPIPEERVRVDTGRNIWTGVSFCSASATAEYE